jgi:hypothetical protein
LHPDTCNTPTCTIPSIRLNVVPQSYPPLEKVLLASRYQLPSSCKSISGCFFPTSASLVHQALSSVANPTQKLTGTSQQAICSNVMVPAPRVQALSQNSLPWLSWPTIHIPAFEHAKRIKILPVYRSSIALTVTIALVPPHELRLYTRRGSRCPAIEGEVVEYLLTLLWQFPQKLITLPWTTRIHAYP